VTGSDPNPTVRYVQVDPDRNGQRLDNFLMSLLDGVPRSMIYRLVRTGQVRINGSRAKPMKKLRSGDEIRVPPVRQSAPEAVRVPAGLVEEIRGRIVHRNEDFTVIDKPAGLAMHGGSGLSYGLMSVLARINENWRPVHRLDRPTSGLVLIACRHQALVKLQKLFTERRLTKRYLALLEGHLPDEETRVEAPLKKIRDGSGQRRVIAAADGQAARSVFRVLERIGRYSYVEVEIESGRTHQIRAHASHIGHAVVGDERYNPASGPVGLKRLFLHSHFLAFDWPEQRIFSAPLPAELGQVLTDLREQLPTNR
jgi:23S rRNA pseudouridine955/2504/2580 synthase